jgi:hypothetical protein
MTEYKDLLKLMRAAFGAEKGAAVAYSEGSENYSSSEVSEALSNEFRKLVCKDNGEINYQLYQQNKYTIFSLIDEVVTEIVPKRVEAQYAQLAETRTVAQGDKYVFKVKVTDASKRRAKTFVTQVGLAGRYETFALDGKTFEVQTNAIGGAARIGFEEFLDGRWEFSDFTSLILEGIDECLYTEIMKALEALAANLPASNVKTANGFIEDDFDDLLDTIDVYGKATIYCTREFANKMVPSDARMSDAMKDTLWANGYFANYKGHGVVILDQSFTDTTNKTKVVNPQLAYIIPTGSDKPVKVVMEGSAQTRTVDNNDDWSTDIQTYLKVGVATIAQIQGDHFIGAYTNTALSQTR